MQVSSTDRFKIIIFISGRGSNLKAILEEIKTGKIPAEVCCVLSNTASAPGLDIAREYGIETRTVQRKFKTQTIEEFDDSLLSVLADFSPDLIVLAGFMCVLGEKFISRYSDKIINIHPALLPSFKGIHAQKQALEAGVKFSGCTVHYVVPQVDAGPIIGQAVVPVFKNDTEDNLAKRISTQEHKLFPRIVAEIAKGNIFLKDGNVIFKKELQTVSPDSYMLSI